MNTHFIYKHFKGTKFSVFKNGGKEIIFDFTDFEDGKLEGRCFLCGYYTTKGVPTKVAIKKTFTDFDYCKNKESEVVCECCNFALSYKQFRLYGIFCDKSYGTIVVNQSDYKDIIIDNATTPYIICIPTTGRKWLHYKAKLNRYADYLQIQYGDNVVSCTKKEFKETIDLVEYLLDNKIKKAEILTGDYNHSKIKKIGLYDFKAVEDELKKNTQYTLF